MTDRFTRKVFGKDAGRKCFAFCHDRFIIVDQKENFWAGASLKDAGRSGREPA